MLTSSFKFSYRVLVQVYVYMLSVKDLRHRAQPRNLVSFLTTSNFLVLFSFRIFAFLLIFAFFSFHSAFVCSLKKFEKRPTHLNENSI